jgi:hypothetical protein
MCTWVVPFVLFSDILFNFFFFLKKGSLSSFPELLSSLVHCMFGWYLACVCVCVCVCINMVISPNIDQKISKFI